MAYYTVAHLLQGGVFDGSAGSPLGIRYESNILIKHIINYILSIKIYFNSDT